MLSGRKEKPTTANLPPLDLLSVLRYAGKTATLLTCAGNNWFFEYDTVQGFVAGPETPCRKAGAEHTTCFYPAQYHATTICDTTKIRSDHALSTNC